MTTYHNILGTNNASTKQEIKHRYLLLSSQCHPDKNGSTELFKLINEANQQVNNGRGDDKAFNNNAVEYIDNPIHSIRIIKLIETVEQLKAELEKAEQVKINARSEKEESRQIVTYLQGSPNIIIVTIALFFLAFYSGVAMIERKYSLNKVSKHEDSVVENVIKRQTLHHHLSDTKRAILEWKTTQFHIRIDKIRDQKYRYSAWKTGAEKTDEPSLVLFNGELVHESNDAHYYSFKNGTYTYNVNINVNLPQKNTLTVFKEEDVLLTEHVIEVLIPELQ